MYSHVFVGVTDFERALAFYTPVMAALGQTLRFCEHERPWAGWQTPGVARPLFLIGAPFDGAPAAPGNGPMTAFLAADRATVRAVHAVALAHGGRCDGPPGLRPHYHPDYYGAYVRDPDGNKLAVACHTPEPAPELPVT
jgi:catechol 2,3-dioxygenase-like lactoylglutathione lyase family enzyme